MQGYEDVTLYELSDAREAELLEKQVECNFIWTNKDGARSRRDYELRGQRRLHLANGNQPACSYESAKA